MNCGEFDDVFCYAAGMESARRRHNGDVSESNEGEREGERERQTERELMIEIS